MLGKGWFSRESTIVSTPYSYDEGGASNSTASFSELNGIALTVFDRWKVSVPMYRIVAIMLVTVCSIVGSAPAAPPVTMTRSDFLSQYRLGLPLLLKGMSNIEAKGTLRRRFDDGGYTAEFVAQALGDRLLVDLIYDPNDSLPEHPMGHVYCFGEGFGFTLRRTDSGYAFQGGGSTANDVRIRFMKYHRFGRFLSSSLEVVGRRLIVPTHVGVNRPTERDGTRQDSWKGLARRAVASLSGHPDAKSWAANVREAGVRAST